MNWNASVQHEFTRDYLIDVSYQGSNGVGLIEVRALGGAFADVDPMATAFAHRRQGIFVSAGAGRYAEAAVADLWSSLEPQLDGLYSAYTSDTRPQQILRARNGVEFPMTEADMKWQIEFIEGLGKG